MSEERVSRSAGFAFSAQMVGAVLTAGLTIFLARRLTADQYGNLTFALSVLAIATLFADLGTTPSAGRYMAERRDRPEDAANVMRTATRLKMRVGLVASVALFALAGPICELFGTSAAAWPLRALAIALLGQSMFMLLAGAFIALGKLRYNLLIATVESVVEVLASVVLVLLGAGATGAAFGNAIGYFVAVVVGFVVVRRTIGRLRRSIGETPVVSARQILRYAGPLLLVDAAYRIYSSIDVLLIAALVGGSAQIAAFGLPMRLAAFLDYPAGAVASAIAPRFARRERLDSEMELFVQSTRYLVIMQMLFTAPLLVWSEAIVHLIFGDKYPEAPAVLRALTPYVFFAGLGQITTLSVNYLGYARLRVPIVVAMLTVNIVIDVVLLPRIGIVAGAIGTSAAYALWVPAHLWVLRQKAGLPLRPLLITGLRTCIAGAAMAGVLAAIGTGQVALGLMLVGALAGPLVYFAALLLLRELSLAEILDLRSVLARRVAA